MNLRLWRLVHVLVLLSGATALLYQVTWVRNLTLVFGASFQATSIVLASFMGGLSLGGFLSGRYGERAARPLRLYALLELGVAGFAAALPLLLGLADALYVGAAREAEGVTPILNFVRIALAFGILLLPTLLMGATLPVLMSALSGRFDEFGTRFSWLYGINTLGAAVGAVVTGFVLIPAFGVWHTQLLAIATNVAIALVALSMDRITGVSRGADDARAFGGASPEWTTATAPSPPRLELAQRLGVHLAYRGAAVSGMCALALEVMWTRALSVAVGTTTYSFTVMLAAFLMGIWLGSWLHALFPARRISIHMQLGGAMLVIGVSSLLASYAIPRLPELVVQLNVWLYGADLRIRPVTALLAGFVVMLIPCIFMGIAFPLTGEARARLIGGFGRSAGDTLGWNTLGSIVGSLLAGFALIPFMGLQRGMLLVAGIYAAYGFLLVGAPLVAGPSRHRWVALGATMSLVLLALSLPAWVPRWDIGIVGGFQNNKAASYVNQDIEVSVREELTETVVLYYREGRTSTVSIVEDTHENWSLLVNGKAVASDNPTDIQIQLMLGHVPLLVHPSPKTALVIGLGTGITLGSVTAHESLEEITLVEIEPAILGAQPYFAGVNGDPLSDPRLSVEIQDGRNYLKTTKERFDVITADPIHPWNQGSSYLFTSEYYAIAKQRLNAGGIMCQWLPIYSLSVDNFKSIVATFNGAFAHTMLWQNVTDSVLIGSDSPIRIDLSELAIRLAEPSTAAQLDLIGLGDPYSFVAEVALQQTSIREYSRGGIINTDDNLHLEFASPFDIGSRAMVANIRELNRYRGRIGGDPEFLILPEPEREAVDRAREAKRETLDIAFRRVPPREKVRSLRKILEDFPDYQRARRLLSSRLAIRGVAEMKRSRIDIAFGFLEEAVELDPRSADAHGRLGSRLLISGRFEESIRHLQRSMELRPGRWRTHALLNRALLGAGRAPRAQKSLRAAIDIDSHQRSLAAWVARLQTGHALPAKP